jgi:peptidoglycan LD-endopeptidase CwlK
MVYTMPSIGNINRDRTYLYPPFAAKLLHFDEILKERGMPFSLFVGFRTFAEQDALFNQGRGISGKIVTNAKGGLSWHNYGLAADYVAHPRESIWSWDESIYNYKEMAEIATGECGLTAGYFWKKEIDGFRKDAPHIQFRSRVAVSTMYSVYCIRYNLQDVWDTMEI